MKFPKLLFKKINNLSEEMIPFIALGLMTGIGIISFLLTELLAPQASLIVLLGYLLILTVSFCIFLTLAFKEVRTNSN